jgi:electron transfer flavoprotein beta subunit
MNQTFDKEEKIVLQHGTIIEDGVNFVINPYDEYGIEEAIRIREKFGGEVTVITVGPERSESALRTALAMGADKAVLVDSEDFDLDEYSTAKVLAEVIKEYEFDIIIGGNVSIDNGSGQVGPRVAEELGIPQVTTITKIDIMGNEALIERDVEGDTEIVQVSLPVLVTAQQGLNEPRYPSLPGIMKAKKKSIERIAFDDLFIAEDVEVKTFITETFFPMEKKDGQILKGQIRDQVKDLANLLRSEVNVI